MTLVKRNPGSSNMTQGRHTRSSKHNPCSQTQTLVKTQSWRKQTPVKHTSAPPRNPLVSIHAAASTLDSQRQSPDAGTPGT
eukprot:247260-Rhodomonas_salina.1